MFNLKNMTITLVLTGSMWMVSGPSQADMWNDVQYTINSTASNVYQRAGNSLNDVRRRVNQVSKGLSGAHDRAYDELKRNFNSLTSCYGSHCSSQ